MSTVREVEFRSRWSNYHVDQPRVEAAVDSQVLSVDPVENEVNHVMRSLLRTGSVILRGSLTTGWETSSRTLQATRHRDPGSSLFIAPALAASYDREVGAWTVSFRYSAGYLRYLDGSYSSDGAGAGQGSNGTSQTAALDIGRQGSRLAVRSNAYASSGSGYDIERNGQIKRTVFGEGLLAEYALTEFLHAGFTGATSHETYTTGGLGADTTVNRWAGAVYGECILTGKTTVRAEFGTGHDSQLAGQQSAFDRGYY